MIPGLIFVLLFLTMLQFFVSYTHSLILESQGHELSERACEICGFTAKPVAGNEFRRLQQLIALCPRLAADGYKIRAVALYFGLLGLTRILLKWLMPSATVWIEKERGGCAYFAAVDLDRRIVYSRMKMAGQES
jgi:Na+-transporting methylmalonyl-CoA/oxaloacetate decarboxylase gamma subunit